MQNFLKLAQMGQKMSPSASTSNFFDNVVVAYENQRSHKEVMLF